MREYLKENPQRIRKFPPFPPKKKLTIDAVTMLLPSEHTQYQEIREFIAGTEPTEKSHKASEQEINDYLERNFSDDRFSLMNTEEIIKNNLEIIDIDSIGSLNSLNYPPRNSSNKNKKKDSAKSTFSPYQNKKRSINNQVIKRKKRVSLKKNLNSKEYNPYSYYKKYSRSPENLEKKRGLVIIKSRSLDTSNYPKKTKEN